MLRTERGLRGLLKRHALTTREYALLVDNPTLAAQARYLAVLEGIITRFLSARRTGELEGSVALEARAPALPCPQPQPQPQPGPWPHPGP